MGLLFQGLSVGDRPFWDLNCWSLVSIILDYQEMEMSYELLRPNMLIEPDYTTRL